MANLVLLQAGQSTSYALTGAESVIGRHPECAVHVDSNMVSRKHARVFQDGEAWFIEDLGSGNGTVVNGQRIAAKMVLNHEDRVTILSQRQPWARHCRVRISAGQSTSILDCKRVPMIPRW